MVDEGTGEILTREQLASLRVVPEIVHPDAAVQPLLNVVKAARQQQVAHTLTHNERVIGLAGIQNGCAVVRPQHYLDFLETNGASGLTLGSIDNPAILYEAVSLWSWLGIDFGEPFQDALIASVGDYPAYSSAVATHTIGVAAIMQTSDGWYLPVVRDATVVGVNTEGLNLAPTGAATWDGSVGGELLIERLIYALAEEAEEEFGLHPRMYSTVFLGGARELPRGGSPEFFFLMQLKLTREQMCDYYEAFDGIGKKEALAMMVANRRQMLNGRVMHQKLRVAVKLMRECGL